MPNWCEGWMKIRGKRKDVIRFFNEGVELNGDDEEKGVTEPIIKETFDDEIWFNYLRSPYYVKDTRRGFITDTESVYLIGKHEKATPDDIVETAFLYKQAWGIDSGELIDISKKYEIDIKIFAVECGMEFAQDIEIHKGETVTDRDIKYDDFLWDCPMPYMGG